MGSVKKNFIYNSAFQIINIVIPLITTPYLARIFRPEGVGIYSYAYTIANYFVIVSMLGLYNYGNRSIARVSDEKQECDKVFCEIYCMQLFTTFSVNVLYVVYLTWLTNDIMAWVLIPYLLSAVFDVNWYFFGVERFKLTAIRSIIIKILSTLFIFVLVRSRDDLYIYGFIMGLGFLVSQLSVWPVLIRGVRFTKPKIKDILKHVKPNLILFVPVISITLYKMMDKIMLGALINKTQVGFYDSAEKIIQIPLGLIIALGIVMLPRMSNLAVNNKTEKSVSYIKMSLIIAAFISTSTCFGIMGVSKEFVPLFYGQGYETCITLLLILLPSCIFMALANVIRTQYLVPQQLDKIYIISVSLGALVNLVLNALLIPRFESAGAAIGTLCAEFFVAFYQMIAIQKQLPIFRFLKFTIPFLVAGIIMFAFLYFISFSTVGLISLVIKILLGACVYFATAGSLLFIFKRYYVSFLEISLDKVLGGLKK